MYKLLTTAAVIMTVATPSFAWDGAAKLIQNLDTVYGGVDGQDQFTNLSNGGGELNTFLSDVNQGVTHVTLTVNTDNTITPEINKGKTLTQLQDTASDLVNRVNYDLFHDATPEDAEDDGVVAGGYVSTTDYTLTNDADSTSSYIDHTTDLANLGLVGNKINDIVTAVDSINQGLINAADIDGGLTAGEQNDAFINAYDNNLNEEHFGVFVGDFKSDITEINTSVTAAGGADFFGNTANFAIDGNTLNNFAISNGSFVGDGVSIQIGTEDPTVYTSLLDWANAVNPPPAP